MSAAISFAALVSCAVLLALLLASCSSAELVRRSPALADEPAAPVRYTVICFIHGDGDYVYHDSLGNERRADEDALMGAAKVAENNPLAEVFIFHEQPAGNVLFFFPRHDGEFTYYRNGRLLARESYPRGAGLTRFDAPARFYEEFRARERVPTVKMALYFGHELPETGSEEDALDRPFTVPEFAAGLQRLAEDSAPFDLVVLSSCFNGTPYTVSSLAPYAHTIVASPDNLHLSYFDLRPLERLGDGLPDGDVPAFARTFALRSFERLTEEIQTAVTVAVYDVDRVEGYLHSVDSVDRQLRALNSDGRAGPEHCDCAENPAYVLPTMSDGVEVFYRPARFGRSKNKQHHSGWQCWKESELRANKAAE